MNTSHKYWVIRCHGRCVFGILEINERYAWHSLASKLMAIHGVWHTEKSLRELGIYESEEIEVPAKPLAGDET
jgi:hypothetical protein